MADDLGLLLDPVARERAVGIEPIGIAAEGVAHQRQPIFAAGLRLPDMGQLVDEQALRGEGIAGEIVGPGLAVGVEMDVSRRRHDRVSRLERPPRAVDEAHRGIVDRVGEDGSGKLDLAGSERAFVTGHGTPMPSFVVGDNQARLLRPASAARAVSKSTNKGRKP